MPKAKTKPYDRAALLAVAKTWAKHTLDEIEQGCPPSDIVGSAKVLTVLACLAAEYEEEEDPRKLRAMQAIIASHAVDPQFLYDAMDGEDFYAREQVDALVIDIESGMLDD